MLKIQAELVSLMVHLGIYTSHGGSTFILDQSGNIIDLSGNGYVATANGDQIFFLEEQNGEKLAVLTFQNGARLFRMRRARLPAR